MTDTSLPEQVTPESVNRYIDATRDGVPDALGKLLGYYTGYLLAIARREFDPSLTGKLSPTDVVQETFLDAQRDFGSFESSTEEELRGWLRALLMNNLTDCRRLFLETKKRDISREFPMYSGLADSSSGLADPAYGASPLTRMINDERERALQTALDRLSSDDRRMIHLHHQRRLSFVEIAKRMGINAGCARMRYVRALGELRRYLDEPIE